MSRTRIQRPACMVFSRATAPIGGSNGASLLGLALSRLNHSRCDRHGSLCLTSDDLPSCYSSLGIRTPISLSSTLNRDEAKTQPARRRSPASSNPPPMYMIKSPFLNWSKPTPGRCGCPAPPKTKKADVAEHPGYSTTSAYSLTSPPVRPGCSSSSHPTTLEQLLPRVELTAAPLTYKIV